MVTDCVVSLRMSNNDRVPETNEFPDSATTIEDAESQDSDKAGEVEFELVCTKQGSGEHQTMRGAEASKAWVGG
jgi:hypothetical protein